LATCFFYQKNQELTTEAWSHGEKQKLSHEFTRMNTNQKQNQETNQKQNRAEPQDNFHSFDLIRVIRVHSWLILFLFFSMTPW
jgi:hypothetical protein